MSKIVDKIDEAQTLLGGIAEDIQRILGMAKLTIPMVENTVEQAKERIRQIEKLFTDEEGGR